VHHQPALSFVRPSFTFILRFYFFPAGIAVLVSPFQCFGDRRRRFYDPGINAPELYRPNLSCPSENAEYASSSSPVVKFEIANLNCAANTYEVICIGCVTFGLRFNVSGRSPAPGKALTYVRI
jgi:hypothetical protein